MEGYGIIVKNTLQRKSWNHNRLSIFFKYVHCTGIPWLTQFWFLQFRFNSVYDYLLNDGAKRNRFHIWKSCIQPLEKSYICTFFGDFSSPKVNSTCNTYWDNKKSWYRLIFAHFLVTFLALRLIQYVIVILKAHFCTFFGNFSSPKVDSICN